ncbi:MAG: hypothetical protein JSV81_02800 [Anaerolineales bacterium]|nr:MAG: hypothetical protein JSV81_02800 [Anaerolineales bacterium]UCF37741.1 MAG: hypothetical protein JSU96_02420 [Acidobacteriota bacterium]
MKTPKIIVILIGLTWMTFQALNGQPQTSLKPETASAFADYVKQSEAELDQRLSGEAAFLTVDGNPSDRQRVLSSEIVVKKIEPDVKVPSGLLHDWVGTLFIPEATGLEVVKVLLDYDNPKHVYPEALDSKLKDQQNGMIHGFLQLRKKKVITVVLNVDNEITLSEPTQGQWHIRSHSTKISEVKNHGKEDEHELPAGQDSGFMWNLNAYWWLQDTDNGVFVECRAISLSREIPWLFRWIVKPFVTSIPKESLIGTLTATREEVKRRQ